MTRPPTPPPTTGRDGIEYRHVARPASDLWRPARDGRQCSRHRCGQPAKVELNRCRQLTKPLPRIQDAWYAYCEEHGADYGIWAEGGEVWFWAAVPVRDAVATL